MQMKVGLKYSSPGLSLWSSITNIQHKSEMYLTPWLQRSRESSLISVVLPLPVGPVKTVSSPGLKPLRCLASSGNLCHWSNENKHD